MNDVTIMVLKRPRRSAMKPGIVRPKMETKIARFQGGGFFFS